MYREEEEEEEEVQEEEEEEEEEAEQRGMRVESTQVKHMQSLATYMYI